MIIEFYFSLFAAIVSILSIVISIAANIIAQKGNEIAKHDYILNRNSQQPLLLLSTSHNISIQELYHSEYDSEIDLYSKFTGIFFGTCNKNSLVLTLVFRNTGDETINRICFNHATLFTKDCIDISNIGESENYLIFDSAKNSFQDVYLPKNENLLVHLFIPKDDFEDKFKDEINDFGYSYLWLQLQMSITSIFQSTYDETLEIDLHNNSGNLMIRKMVPYIKAKNDI